MFLFTPLLILISQKLGRNAFILCTAAFIAFVQLKIIQFTFETMVDGKLTMSIVAMLDECRKLLNF
jgi:hypothetical protein